MKCIKIWQGIRFVKLICDYSLFTTDTKTVWLFWTTLHYAQWFLCLQCIRFKESRDKLNPTTKQQTVLIATSTYLGRGVMGCQHILRQQFRAYVFTHLHLDQMAAISQKKVSNAFSWMKKFIRILLTFVTKGPVNNTPALFQIMVWRRSGYKPLSEPMLTQFTDAYMRNRGSWVNNAMILTC